MAADYRMACLILTRPGLTRPDPAWLAGIMPSITSPVRWASCPLCKEKLNKKFISALVLTLRAFVQSQHTGFEGCMHGFEKNKKLLIFPPKKEKKEMNVGKLRLGYVYGCWQRLSIDVNLPPSLDLLFRLQAKNHWLSGLLCYPHTARPRPGCWRYIDLETRPIS